MMEGDSPTAPRLACDFYKHNGWLTHSAGLEGASEPQDYGQASITAVQNLPKANKEVSDPIYGQALPNAEFNLPAANQQASEPDIDGQASSTIQASDPKDIGQANIQQKGDYINSAAVKFNLQVTNLGQASGLGRGGDVAHTNIPVSGIAPLGHQYIVSPPYSSSSEGGGHGAPRRNYDVFLNHRGPDVRKSFVDHLSASLESCGVHSFVDYKELYRGEDSWHAIESAICHNKIHIAIFSQRYAESSWCWKELHEMLECRANGSSHLFLPVFYKVSPGDLCNSSSPSSCFSSAFAKLLRWNDTEVVQNWRSALYQASMVNGWTLDAVQRTLLHIANDPVGVNEKLQEALDLMEIDKVQKGGHILGIFGMGGVGRTTLAKSIYNDIYRKFQCWSFMQNVILEAKASSGLRGVQERMLRALLKNKSITPVEGTSHGKQIMRERLSGLKILIILDDVDEWVQLEELLPPLECLKDGSQIVITSRDEQIVIWAKAQHKINMQGLSEPHAHLLFNWHAFLRREEPSEDFKRLAKKVVDACQGLPLALETLGSHL